MAGVCIEMNSLVKFTSQWPGHHDLLEAHEAEDASCVAGERCEDCGQGVPWRWRPLDAIRSLATEGLKQDSRSLQAPMAWERCSDVRALVYPVGLWTACNRGTLLSSCGRYSLLISLAAGLPNFLHLPTLPQLRNDACCPTAQGSR